MGTAFHSVDPRYGVWWENDYRHTRPKIQVIDDDIYSLFRGITCHRSPILLYGEEFFSISLTLIFPVQVWQWRILTIKMRTQMCEEQHNQFLYLCNTNNPNQRNLKSLLFSDFLWVHLQYLHLNVIWFPMVLIARKAFFLNIVHFFLSLRCQKLFCCLFITWMIIRLHWKF